MTNEAIYSWNLEFFLLGTLNTDSIVLFVIGLFTFSMSFWVSSVSLCFLYTFLFHLRYLMVGAQLFIVFSYKPVMWEIWVRSLGWEDPLEKGKAPHSSILSWGIPWTVHGLTKSWTRLSDFYFQNNFNLSW